MGKWPATLMRAGTGSGPRIGGQLTWPCTWPKSHRRRNVGRALYAGLLGILREQGFVKAYAGITLPNAASIGLHEAVGFAPTAVFRGEGFKLGKWRDVGWWELSLQRPTSDPPEPRAIGDVRDGATVAAALASGERLLRPGGGV